MYLYSVTKEDSLIRNIVLGYNNYKYVYEGKIAKRQMAFKMDEDYNLVCSECYKKMETIPRRVNTGEIKPTYRDYPNGDQDVIWDLTHIMCKSCASYYNAYKMNETRNPSYLKTNNIKFVNSLLDNIRGNLKSFIVPELYDKYDKLIKPGNEMNMSELFKLESYLDSKQIKKNLNYI